MPRFLVPRKHGPHRIAAIALYRALLRQTYAACDGPLAFLSHEQQIDLVLLIRHRFRHNIHLQSRRLLAQVFNHGWDALDALDGAVSSSTSPELRAHNKSRIIAHLSQSNTASLLSRLRTDFSSPPRRHPDPRAPIFPAPDAALKRRPLPFENLRPRVPGTIPRRHVPVLINANKFPMLRFGKPQPQALGGYIDSLTAQRGRRWTRVEEYEQHMKLGSREDEWDGLVGQGKEKDASWVTAGKMSLAEVMGAISKRDEASVRRAKWYLQIVDAEKMKADEERKERVMQRNKKAWERKRERYKAEGKVWLEQGTRKVPRLESTKS
ncbi:hypothetical protein K461DRAFT_323611 [Myriangium duriaei CBS 260.36]|uniref:Uncharacterized protein n=1 Tax=Myriangium duriaei CBS 260.36 TaxID=1168546 RepID=A0A9P4IUE4_9PEZI|nr:hypothetical protein K461DRAFT_323611 [Myriangium duriaei CBS 260.36]